MTDHSVLALALAAASQSLNRFNQVVLVGRRELEQNRNIDGSQGLQQALLALVLRLRMIHVLQEGSASLALPIQLE